MAATTDSFRSSLHGFNRMDVVQFIQKTTSEHELELRRLAEDNGIPWQTKHRVAGGTDARAIQRSRAGVRVAGIAAAVRNIHTPSSTASIADCEALLRLARLFIQAVAEENGRNGTI